MLLSAHTVKLLAVVNTSLSAGAAVKAQALLISPKVVK